jgi:ribosomal protein S6
MSDTTVSAAEVNAHFDERNSYEFAFHILPTVAEGEVPDIFAQIKAKIAGVAEITSEEAPERIDLVYPIVKSMEGKNRKFTSAYFGWVRMKLESATVATLTEELSTMPTMLRHLLVKLTKAEEAHLFRFHENRKSVKMVETVDEEVAVIDDSHTVVEENVEISESALDESLEKITEEGEEKK